MKRAVLVLAVLCALTSVVAWAAPKAVKKVYVPMDYSTCGYRASEEVLPRVSNVVYVPHVKGDNWERIQKAIDYVSLMTMGQQGRGAVLLGEGTFEVSRPLRVGVSGVVLRGMGRDKTKILKKGYDRGAVIYIEGRRDAVSGDTVRVLGDVTLAGSRSLAVSRPNAFREGDRINIVRPSTKEWIEHLGMEDFGGGLDYTGWKPTDIDITWDRTVVGFSGDSLVLDAPITTTISKEFGGAYAYRVTERGEVTECGVENMTLEAAVNDWNPKDEDHAWDGVFMENARDCWVSRVTFRHLSGSAVNLQKHVSRVTVEDCISEEPVSETAGWRRCTFLTRGQQCLFQRCISRQGIHDFAAGFCAAGPNAFVQCEAEECVLGGGSFSGSIGSWAAGLLFDIVNIDGGDLRLGNLEQFQFGTGWNSANSMVWQSTASTIACYSPDTLNRCSGHGCWGTLTGNAEWTSSNDHVQPRSLFYSQLASRMGSKAINGYILPIGSEASSSPTVEQAMKLAQQSLTTPRLTMEKWIEQVPYLASVSSSGLKSVDNVSVAVPSWDEELPAMKFALRGGYVVADGEVVVGNRYAIPWWSGRVKDNFVKHGALPAITRFVPGREGVGWTDRVDSVVDYMVSKGYAMLDHHYGLWYDLRRTDHERIRRADGDVWAPFYEQAFARSGQGTAWDGLSKYDLTKPNEWYWMRLNEFGRKMAAEGGLLYCQHYFQHNILEAGAHWVDCPWRPVNNINDTDFPEPVPFAGDKRIFMAEQFYDLKNDKLRALHEGYITMCLDKTKDLPNVVHVLSDEYTGPEAFVRFWLETIAAWEKRTGRHVLVALSCTKDAQDAILADEELRKVVDIIDIRYWHYNTQGLWAPEAGKNLAPRQWMRKMKVGKTTKTEAYKAVSEYRRQYPDKAVAFFSQQYPDYGWAILMAGGSIANVRLQSSQLKADIATMKPTEEGGVWLLKGSKGMLAYVLSGEASVELNSGKYNVWSVDERSGEVRKVSKGVRHSGGKYKVKKGVTWLERVK